MTNEKWIMVFVSVMLSAINLLFLRAITRKIKAAKAAGKQIPPSLDMQAWFHVMSVAGFVAWWCSLLWPPAGPIPNWILTLEAILTGPTAAVVTVVALLIATLFTVTADD